MSQKLFLLVPQQIADLGNSFCLLRNLPKRLHFFLLVHLGQLCEWGSQECMVQWGQREGLVESSVAEAGLPNLEPGLEEDELSPSELP